MNTNCLPESAVHVAMTINGRAEAAKGTFGVINPATGRIFAFAPDVTQEQVTAAVTAASKAFPGWSAMPIAERRSQLHKVGEVLLTHCDELARILTQEQGKPLRDSKDEVRASAQFIDALISIEMPSEELISTAHVRVEMRRRPLGVVAAIAPWNAPLVIAAATAASALVTGNTLVFKPSPYTPLATLRFGELSRDVLPPGVLNVISGGDRAGAWLVEDPNVKKIAFTGSLETGKKIMRGAADTLKRLTLELGGNDAAIILPDADPKRIAGEVFTAAFRNCGQICNSIKRLYVHDVIYEEMCAELGRVAERIVVGDGMDERSELGPLQNRQQYEKVKALLADSERRGARVMARGTLPVASGYFMRPTIVSEIKEGARLVDEEQFGPVLPVIRFSDVEEALRMANQTDFGLGASVWTSDLEAGEEIASRMEAGTVWVNQHGQLDPSVPFGGIKHSGVGVQYSTYGLAEFTTIQILRVATG